MSCWIPWVSLLLSWPLCHYGLLHFGQRSFWTAFFPPWDYSALYAILFWEGPVSSSRYFQVLTIFMVHSSIIPLKITSQNSYCKLGQFSSESEKCSLLLAIKKDQSKSLLPTAIFLGLLQFVLPSLKTRKQSVDVHIFSKSFPRLLSFPLQISSTVVLPYLWFCCPRLPLSQSTTVKTC